MITKTSKSNLKHDVEPKIKYRSEHYTTQSVSHDEAEGEGVVELCEMEMGLKEVCDPSVAVKGHGLIRLSRLVELRCPVVGERRDLLCSLFCGNVSHSDSYVYLNAVRGLTALSLSYPEDCLHVVVNLYAEQESVEVKLKTGGSTRQSVQNVG